MLDRELKKGSAELIILSIVETRARHGYEISKLIETRSAGQLKFHVASLYPLLYRLEERGWLQGKWVEKAGQRRRRFYRLTAEGRRVLAQPAQHLEDLRRTPCGSSPESTMPDRKLDRRTCRAAVCAVGCALQPRRAKREIVEELSQHLDDRYEELRAERRRATPRRGASRSRNCASRTRSRAHMRVAAAGARPAADRAGRAAAAASLGGSLAGPALRGPHAAQAAGIHGRRRADAGARHRREHRDLQPRQRHAASSACRSRIATELVYVYPRQRRRVLLSGLRALRDGKQRRSTASPAWGGITASLNAGDSAELVDGFIVTGNFFDVLGVARRARAAARRAGRRHAGRASGGGDQPRLLAGAFRRPSRTSSAARSG